MINFFFNKKKLDIPKWSFSDFETEPETPFGNRKFFFLKIWLTSIAFWGKIYRKLPWRWISYIIISGSRSKVEKKMKNSDFWNFDCDPEIMLKWLQHHGSLQWIPTQKTLWSTFFPQKKIGHPKMVVFRFWDRTWDRFRESKIFFSQNLTYSYSFLGWNLPGITMSLES